MRILILFLLCLNISYVKADEIYNLLKIPNLEIYKLKSENNIRYLNTKVPRYAGPSTFARLPELRDVESCDVAIVGVPFDSGTSYRPGARFGPQSIRQASRHLRTNYHPSYDVEPFKVQQVADAGDIACNPFNIDEAIKQIEVGATDLLNKVGGIISCLLYTSPSPRDRQKSRMPSSA